MGVFGGAAIVRETTPGAGCEGTAVTYAAPRIRRLVTHAGPFHADDVFAAATLRRLWPRAKIERTRDAERLACGRDDPSTVVFDVGDAYEPERRNFDHHQRSFERRRANGVPYAAFGLIWESFGQGYLRALLGDEPFETFPIEGVATLVERRLVWAIDAADCGRLAHRAWLRGGDEEEDQLEPTSASTLISSLNPVGGPGQRLDFDGAFAEAVAVAARVLEGCARRALLHFEAAQRFRRRRHGAACRRPRRLPLLALPHPGAPPLRGLPLLGGRRVAGGVRPGRLRGPMPPAPGVGWAT